MIIPKQFQDWKREKNRHLYQKFKSQTRKATYIRRRIQESPILSVFIKDGTAPGPVVHCPVTSINIQSSIAPGARRRVKHQDVEHFSQAPQCAIQAGTPQYVTLFFLYKKTR